MRLHLAIYAVLVVLLSAAPLAYAQGNAVTQVVVVATASHAQSNVPVTFGQPFARGDVPSGYTVVASLSNGKTLPTQVDVKARNADGSIRHAIITLELPHLGGGSHHLIQLTRVKSSTVSDVATQSSPSLPARADADIDLNIKGQHYRADLRHLLQNGRIEPWLTGPLVQSWIVSGPLVNDHGVADKHLQARFAVRVYHKAHRVRVSYVVENDFVFVPGPHNYQYDATLGLDGQTVYQHHDLENYYATRWRHVAWSGGDPQTYVNQNPEYLKHIGVIANYDPQLRISGAAIAKWVKVFDKKNSDPMHISVVTNPMGQGGGRPDIGPLPSWTVMYLLTGDPRMWRITRTVADTAASWPVHLRDRKTNHPVSIQTYPDLSWLDQLRYRGKTPLPKCEGSCRSPYRPDTSHEPSLVFIPYLLTGDHYYLKELQFWANYNTLDRNPAYRHYSKGLMETHQIRGQAWGLRTLANTTYLTPDKDPLKSYFSNMLHQNRDWYTDFYVNGKGDNRYGFGTVGFAFAYNHGRGISPWQDDYFTWSIGYLVKLGYTGWKPFLEWKVRFPIARMTSTDKGFCWCLASLYEMNVRDSKEEPLYRTWSEIYKKNVSPKTLGSTCASPAMAEVFGQHYRAGDMTGYPWSTQGYPSIMQPALAAAVDAGASGARQAWKRFMSRTTKPNYSADPDWDIVPRH